MNYTIEHGMVPLTMVFPAIFERVGGCGNIIFTIASGHLNVGTVVLDSNTRTITVETESGYDVGVYDFLIFAELEDYP